MEFDWSTFALEGLNFLALVWLLKRFFYRPVLEVIEARRAGTARTLADAEAVRLQAEGLKSEYEGHLKEVEKDRAAARDLLDGEIVAERTRRMAALEAEVSRERERRQTLEERERSDRARALERQAMTISARFASRLLERVAGPELDAKLADLALEELDSQTPERLESLAAALREPGVNLKVSSAHPLDAERRAAFTEKLGRLAGRVLAPEFAEDATLKAGVAIMAGSWVLMANLRDELQFFAGAFDADA